MLMQMLALSNEQINALPLEQRQAIQQLVSRMCFIPFNPFLTLSSPSRGHNLWLSVAIWVLDTPFLYESLDDDALYFQRLEDLSTTRF